MSRIGMKPVEIIAGVTVAVAGDKVTVEVSVYDLTQGRITFRAK